MIVMKYQKEFMFQRSVSGYSQPSFLRKLDTHDPIVRLLYCCTPFNNYRNDNFKQIWCSTRGSRILWSCNFCENRQVSRGKASRLVMPPKEKPAMSAQPSSKHWRIQLGNSHSHWKTCEQSSQFIKQIGQVNCVSTCAQEVTCLIWLT